MHSFDPQLITAGQESLTRAVMLHLSDPNVSLIDLGWRILDRQDCAIEPELCVRVHLRQKLRGEAFESFAERNPDRVVDAQVIGFPVDIPEASYNLQPAGFGTAMARSRPVTGTFDPMCGGIGIYNPLLRGFGTLGAKVIDRRDGREMILSNWHVLAGTWYAPRGTSGLEIYHPTRSFNGNDNLVARYSRHAMGQNLDAAVAEIVNGRRLVNQQLGLGPVSGAASPRLDMPVVKSGRTTGVTYGMITGINGYRRLNYSGRRQVIRNIIHIAQSPEGGDVSSAGDSGSSWLVQGTNQAVGLHFAGSNVPEYGLALAMPQVLDALQVDLALM